MSRSTHSDIGCLIRFIPAGDRTDSNKTDTNKPAENKTISGEEAKAFYEELLQEDDTSKQDGERKSCKRKHGRVRESGDVKNQLSQDHNDLKDDLATDCQGSELLGDRRHHQKLPSAKVQSHRNSGGNVKSHCQDNENQMLFCAQNNDFQGLKKLLKSGLYVDIDYTDQYGWTALMCAAVARHSKIVQLLLSKGANKWLNNSNCKSALDLAKEINAQEIVNILTYSGENTRQQRHASVKHKQSESFYCEICKSSFSDSSQKKHCSSTVHLFNLKLKPKPDPFMIPESNIGYRLMRSSGWDGEKGLGPEGKGAKFPVKTVLKTDRLCLGSQESEKKKAKITHFGPNDTDAIKIEHKHTLNRVLSARASSRKERRRRELKEKRWEKNLRQYMDMDCESIEFEKM